jgi:hypothetical protein
MKKAQQSLAGLLSLKLIKELLHYFFAAGALTTAAIASV